VGAAAGAAWLTVCLATTACAADAPRQAPAAGAEMPVERLTRGDVDKLLNQAQIAIREGNLDRAEAIVVRAERAKIRYPLFHFGATPASVRRELSQAQRAGTSRNQPAMPGALADDDGQAVALRSDPFIERPMNVPAPPDSQPLPPSAAGDGMTPPVLPALYHQSVGARDRQVVRASATDQYGSQQPLDPPYPPSLRAAQTASDSEPQLVAPNRFHSDRAAAGRTADEFGAESEGSAEEIGPTSRGVNGNQKSQAQDLLRAARQALVDGDLDQAEQYARRASELDVAESAFLPHEDRPSLLAWDVRQARSQIRGGPAQPAVGTQIAPADRYAAQAALAPAGDAAARTGRGSAAIAPSNANIADMRFAQLPEPLELPESDADLFDDEEPLPVPTAKQPDRSLMGSETGSSPSPPTATDESEAAQLLAAGERALGERDERTAAVLLGQAYLIRDQLEPAEQARLQTHLQSLSSNGPATRSGASRANSPTLLESTDDSQRVLARQLSAEVGKKQADARRLREQDPDQALAVLQSTREKLVASTLTEDYRSQLLRRIDITLEETEKYIRVHRAEIDLERRNQQVLDEIERTREVKVKVQQQVAELVDQFNRLRDEHRFEEMEVVARRLYEIAPDEEVVKQIMLNAKFIRRTMMNEQLADLKEDGIWNQLNDVETSSYANVGDGRELVYGDPKRWEELVKKRKGPGDRNTHRTERELEIERRLKTPVLLHYEDMPLSEVVQGLSQLAGVNIHLDPRGLGQEGINSDTPVTINLSKEISLKSALNLILEPLHLSYVIKDEVLKITSEQLRDGETYSHVYNVADLVIPIPNFVPNNNIGLQGLINDAHAAMGQGSSGLGMPGPTVLVNDPGPRGQAVAGGNVLAQQFGAGGISGAQSSSIPIGSGPGGLGGAANADFDSLIDLIVSTVASETWAENGGGEAEIRPFPTNLSLVISQTQLVHEEIADLLEQLRRLQDLQVTIEVRFIRLNDSFFERIGVDFDMNIEDRTIGTADLVPGAVYEPRRQSAIVGLQFPVDGLAPFPNFTSDLDIPFRQNSFELSRPTVGGPVDVARFGFAILSDIEAYFLIEAAQGDRRTNVLNAPKVTLFNGQQAFVADAVSMPFVLGVIPVVGEFAAAQQPVIVVLNEGTLMTIQAVVSNDRRYVRLTVVPFFTQVGDVQEFTFDGAASTTNSSSTTDDDDDGNEESTNDAAADTRSGVTVQLPAFQFIAVVTTVSVPDGGTVLLGGIKRLSEGRNEVGVPLLSKVPYINRLFKNVGIGRETDSLMMMVTPRIIIQEEEEERLGIVAP
jgi:general secretion pathway protein D